MLDSSCEIVPSGPTTEFDYVVETTLKLAFTFGMRSPEFVEWFVDRVLAGTFVFYNADDRRDVEISFAPVGSPLPLDKAQRYRRNAREKKTRLQEHPDHVASQQSRNEAAEQWTGAIRATSGAIFSFSGQPEEVDEAICLVVAFRLGHFTTYEEMLAVAMTTGNAFFLPFWQFICETSASS